MTDIAFVVDGTLEPEGIALARDFARWVVQRLEGYLPLRLALVLYGEYLSYPHPARRRRHIPYEVLSVDFSAPHVFLDNLDGNLTYHDDFQDQDFCDALELGLQAARGLSWTAPARHLVVVGNSPPHPSAEQRERFRLLDFTASEFAGSDWTAELAALHAEVDPHIYSYYLPPDISPDQAQKDFAAHVWTALDDVQIAIPRTLSADQLGAEVDRLANLIWEMQQQKVSAAAPAHLPLLARR